MDQLLSSRSSGAPFDHTPDWASKMSRLGSGHLTWCGWDLRKLVVLPAAAISRNGSDLSY